MAEDRFGGKYKTVQDSYTECTHCVLSSDINGTGRLFGGRMMEMMDQANFTSGAFILMSRRRFTSLWSAGSSSAAASSEKSIGGGIRFSKIHLQASTGRRT